LIFVKLQFVVRRIVSNDAIRFQPVVELFMDRRVTQPTKEQVRAYMAKRERALRPPPAPEDIRRQLGWKLAPPEATYALINLCLLPAALGQIAAQAVIQLYMVPLRQAQLVKQRSVSLGDGVGRG
jgi:hypothetical protein